MHNRLILLAAILLLSLSNNYCKEEKANLAITLTSLGYNNTHIGYLGGTLGVSAGILAEKKIDNIEIGIRAKDGNLKSGDEIEIEYSAWEFDSVYTDKYSGETETTFIEDILIPLNADTGSYVLSLKVTDLKGNETKVQDDFRLNFGKK